jgi:hypothetical protein
VRYLIVFLLGAAVAVTALLAYQRAQTGKLREHIDRAGGRQTTWPERARQLLNVSRERGRRYEVVVTDQGLGRGESMRYQWVVYDADWALRAEAYPAPSDDPRGSTGDPDGVKGKSEAYDLGNEPSLEEAYDQGLGWVMRQVPGSTVVASVRDLNEAVPGDR